MRFLERRSERAVAPTRDAPTFRIGEPRKDVQVVKDAPPWLLIGSPLAVVVAEPHQEPHADRDKVMLGRKGLGGLKAEGMVL